MNAVRELIRAQLGDQISDEEIDALFGGGGGGGQRPSAAGSRTGVGSGRGQGGGAGGGLRLGASNIQDLNRARNERNNRGRGG